MAECCVGKAALNPFTVLSFFPLNTLSFLHTSRKLKKSRSTAVFLSTQRTVVAFLWWGQCFAGWCVSAFSRLLLSKP